MKKTPKQSTGFNYANNSADYNALLPTSNSKILVSVTDDKGRIIYANDYFVKVSKYTREELQGQNHRILKSGDQPDSLFVDLWKTISKGNVWRGEIKNKAKDDSFYWVDTSITPIIGASGKPSQYISVRFLISDKEAFAKLENQKERAQKFNKVFEGGKLKMADLKSQLKRFEEDLSATN